MSCEHELTGQPSGTKKSGSMHPPPGTAITVHAQSSSCAPLGQSALQYNVLLWGKRGERARI